MTLAEEGDTLIGETPLIVVVFPTVGGSGRDQERGIGNEDDSLSPVLRQIRNLRIQESQGMSRQDEPFVDLCKACGTESPSQRVKGVVSRLNIAGDEAVQIVLSQSLCQLAIRQDTFFDLDHPRQDQEDSVPFRTDSGVSIHHWFDGMPVDGGEVSQERFLLRSQAVDIP